MTNYILTCDSPEVIAQRIRDKSEQTAQGCWEWTSTLDRYGYGRFKVRTGGELRQTGAHRAAWLSMVGDIPEGLQIDHLCRVRNCVNPEHMELVTNQVNSQRQDHSNKKDRSGRHRGGHSGCGRHGFSNGKFREYDAGRIRWVCHTCGVERVTKARLKARA